MAKGNIISLNALRLNSVRVNSTGEWRRGSVIGGGGIVPLPPEIPEEPEEPTPVPTYVLSASVENGTVSASLNGVAVRLPYTANEGDVLVVEVTPNDGYAFDAWSDGVSDNPRRVTMTSDVVLSASCSAVAEPSKYIQFADPAVEAVLMANGVSSDGVGITLEDAAAVKSIKTWFKGNTDITSFDEFRFFGVNSLSIQSFYGCTSLKSIVIPASVSEIPAYGVFQNCTSLQRVTFNGDIAGIYDEAFMGCSALSDINIPESVAGFGNSAFYGCTNMRIHLYLPNLITDSQWSTTRVFANTGILSANFPNVQKLGGDFFAGSKELVKVDIGASAVSIGSSLCNGCTSLTTLICRAVTPPSIGNNIIANAPNAYIYVPDAALEAYKTATNWSTYADRIHPLSEIEGGVVFYDKLVGDGVAYLKTDLMPNSFDNYELDVEPASSVNKFIFGSKSTLLYCGALAYGRSVSYYLYNGNNTSAATQVTCNNTIRTHRMLRMVSLGEGEYRREVFDFDTGDIYVLKSTEITTEVIGKIPILVFCCNASVSSDKADRIYNGAIRSFKVTDARTNEIRMSLRPCTYYGEAGMWDEVSGKFYGSESTNGAFTAEND